MKNLIIKKENNILKVFLNRPELHNAFNPEMIKELTELFLDIKNLEQLRAVVIAGEGKSFCAGADLNWMKSMINYSQEENVIDAEKLYAMFEAMKNCPVPLLGKIHGNVFGGGLGLVAVCDIVVADKQTQFCFSEAKLGLIPAVISSFVQKKMNAHLLREVFLTAEVFDSNKALTSGLINYSGTSEEVEDYLQKKLSMILKCGPQALIATKKLLNTLETAAPDKIRNETTNMIAKIRVSSEGQEGLKSFLEKRKPNWIS